MPELSPESERPKWKFWRIALKRGKPHLTLLVPGEPSGTVALCMKELPENERKGTADTIVAPKDDVCQKCREVAGFYKKAQLTQQQRNEISRTKSLVKVLELFASWGMTQSELRESYEAMCKAAVAKSR